MKCRKIMNLPKDFGECSNKLNHVNQLSIGDEITFKDLDGRKVNGKIIKAKYKKDGTVKYNVEKIS